jgi:hypothetical protein
LRDYESRIWNNSSVGDQDFATHIVSYQDYVEHVHYKDAMTKQDINDGIDKGNAIVASKGFMFPNSAAALNQSTLFIKYMRDIGEKAREIMTSLISELPQRYEQMASAAIDKLSGDMEYNKRHATITSQIADAYSMLQGIDNDINIKAYEMAKKGDLQQLRNAYLKVVALYKADIMITVAMFETLTSRVIAKWDSESTRLLNELKMYDVDLQEYSAKSKFITSEYNAKLQALSDGLVKDVQSFEQSMNKNSAGLSAAFKDLLHAVANSTEAVISVLTSKT